MLAALLLSAAAAAGASDAAPLSVRVGYFLGGRTSLLMRAAESGGLEAEGLHVTLLTKRLRGSEYRPLERAAVEADSWRESKATGVELIAGMLEGRWELATVGEGSFVSAAAHGRPVVAVAALGHDVRGQSGHVFALRRGLEPAGPADYRGLLLITRRAGPGDRALLREYLLRAGVDLERDSLTLERMPADAAERARLPKDKVLLVHDVDDDRKLGQLRSGLADGGFLHLMTYEAAPELFGVVVPLEAWANPEISQALLVCTRDFARSERGRETLRRLLRAVMRRTREEHALAPREREGGRTLWRKLDSRTPGLNYPQYDDVPVVKPYLLREGLELLRRHGAAPAGELRLEDYVDNSHVLSAAAELETVPSWR